MWVRLLKRWKGFKIGHGLRTTLTKGRQMINDNLAVEYTGEPSELKKTKMKTDFFKPKN